MLEEFRVCPECNLRGVKTEEIYPHGVPCLHCRKHIETDKTFSILLTLALVAVMFLDYRALDVGYIGLTCGFFLFFLGGPMKWSHSNFMPLRHYGDI